ncbi:hypothetical protein LMG26411_04854 [Cupriavidus numazuensis]|uniref:Uncharacterized protein n=2 Tax=Cupriavidus numazuensis TaxID=221992 RepID=A0ABM8TMQ2_9BURK|nr:hypothetical protein LMG26411_04854 [Cupriavidus numazuensis]
MPFAPVHAWKILGALKMTEALPALVSLLRRIDDDFDDGIATELPCVFSQMGGQSVDAGRVSLPAWDGDRTTVVEDRDGATTARDP